MGIAQIHWCAEDQQSIDKGKSVDLDHQIDGPEHGHE